MFTSFGVEVTQQGLSPSEAFTPGAPVSVRINSTDNLVPPVTFNSVWEATNFLAGLIEWFGLGLVKEHYGVVSLPLSDCGYAECSARDEVAHGHDETGRRLGVADFLDKRPLMSPEHWQRLGMEALKEAQLAGTASDAQFWASTATKRFARAARLQELAERGHP